MIVLQEFMVQLIHEEKSQAETILKTDLGSCLSLSETQSLSILADPIVFIRRWVGEVSVIVPIELGI